MGWIEAIWDRSDLNRYTGSKIRAVQNARKVIQRRRMSPKSGPKRLRELLQQPGIISSLGAHDVFTALIVEQAGFYALAAVDPLFWTILFWN